MLGRVAISVSSANWAWVPSPLMTIAIWEQIHSKLHGYANIPHLHTSTHLQNPWLHKLSGTTFHQTTDLCLLPHPYEQHMTVSHDHCMTITRPLANIRWPTHVQVTVQCGVCQKTPAIPWLCSSALLSCPNLIQPPHHTPASCPSHSPHTPWSLPITPYPTLTPCAPPTHLIKLCLVLAPGQELCCGTVWVPWWWSWLSWPVKGISECTVYKPPCKMQVLLLPTFLL